MKQQLKCSFIIPGYDCNAYIFRNLDSLFDQDYKNWEAIVVLNGEWNGRKELMASLIEKYGDKISLHWTPEGGLGRANNFGLTKATGDIVSHLSSDLYLLPGTLRTWIEAFEEHPECGFVYSGYKFVSPDPRQIYHSEKWSRYHLECENFVDGANPYRRELAVKWSEDLKSLIDWDWILSLTDNGAQGIYIKEPLYYAELPKPGGLSYDSQDYWEIRRKEVQKRHGIPDRRMCVTSLIFPDYALKLAEMIGADFITYPGFKAHHYSLIYQYGFMADLDNIQASTGVFYRHWGHKVIHWIGQDVLGMIQMRWADVDYYAMNGLAQIKTHWCINPDDQKILTKMGLTPEIIYPPVKWKEISPKKTSISVSDEGLIDQLRKAMPDQEFVFKDTDCFITIHLQDEVVNILESLCKGNYVITDRYFAGSYRMHGWHNIPELRRMVVHTIRQILKAKPELNKDDLAYYRDRVNPDHFKNRLERIAEKKISKYAKLADIESGDKGVFDGVGEA